MIPISYENVCDIFQISVVQDLPVGNNLHNHLVDLTQRFSVSEPITLNLQKTNSIWEKIKYQLFGKGNGLFE